MSDLISRVLILKELERIAEIHPYKVIGDRDSYSPYNEGWSDCVSLIEHYLEQIPSTEPEQRWIPVTEALPKEMTMVLVICADGTMRTSVLTDITYWHGIGRGGVIAWMPLPEPYEEGE